MLRSLAARLSAMTLRHPRATIAILAFAVFTVVFPGNYNSADTFHRLQVARWIWSGAPQVDPGEPDPVLALQGKKGDLDAIFYTVPGRNGQRYPIYGIGESVLMVPGDIIAHLLVDKLAAGVGNAALMEKVKNFVEAYPTFIVIDAVALVLSYELLLALGFANTVALPATILFMIGSTFLVYMQTAQETTPEFLCFVVVLILGLRAEQRQKRSYLLLAGAIAGFSILIRLTDVIYAFVAFLLFVYVKLDAADGGRRTRFGIGHVWSASWEVGLWFAPFLVAGLLLDRIYQFYRFGNFFGTYIGALADYIGKMGGFPPGFPFGYDRVAGFFGPIVTPEKSILLFDPILWFLVAFICFGWRSVPLLPKLVVGCGFLAFLLLCAAYSGFYWWDGDGAWGARHHVVPVELTCLVGFGLLVDRFASLQPRLRALVVANLLIAVACQLVAMPKTHNIEGAQVAAGDPLRVFPLMRVRNLFHIAAGDFHASGLDYGSDYILQEATLKSETRIFAFRLDPLPPPLQNGIIALWMVTTLAATVGVGFVVLQGLRRR